MAYNEILAERVRERLAELPNIVEKAMMGGLTFMYNDKMCVGIIKDELMCRIDPDLHDMAVEKLGCRTMDFTKRPMSDRLSRVRSGAGRQYQRHHRRLEPDHRDHDPR